MHISMIIAVGALTCATALAHAEDKKYSLADLKSLVDEKHYLEAMAHMSDIAPSERKTEWKDLLGMAATGFAQSGKEPIDKLRNMLAIEEHGAGRQLARLRMWPRFSRVAGIIATACIIIAFFAFDAAEHVPAILIGGVFVAIVVRTLQECASTMRETAEALHAQADAPTSRPDRLTDLSDVDVKHPVESA